MSAHLSIEISPLSNAAAHIVLADHSLKMTSGTGDEGALVKKIAQAASLQWLAAIPNVHHSLYARQPILEYDQSSHPFRRELTTSPIEMRNGLIDITQISGLGIEVRRDTIEKYKVN